MAFLSCEEMLAAARSQKITLAKTSEENHVETSQRDRAARRPAGGSH